MIPAARILISVVALTSLVGCGSAPPVRPAGPGEALDAADAYLEKGEPDVARTIMNSVDPDELVGTERERYDVIWATALHRTGSSYDAFKVIREFTDRHRFSDLAPRVEELHYQIGATLADSDTTYFIFGSDKEDGEIVLREFVERFSGNPNIPDALRTLGDLSYDEQRYNEARRRFEQIAQDHPSSEWMPYARYRIAMCAFGVLVGPEYDIELMRRARNELRDYLETGPERPEFRQDASDALAVVAGWMQQRYWTNAKFYRTIESRQGEHNQLSALVREYPECDLATRARERLAGLDGPAPEGESP